MAQATIYLDTNRVISAISPLLFSGFAEHMGRCIYEGIYDPASPRADEHGLRQDVLAALRDLFAIPAAISSAGIAGKTASAPKISVHAGVTSPGIPSKPISLARMSSCIFAGS
jgi:hypothetical protein